MNEENLFEHRDLIIWAAGFIDGEGCISVNRQKHKDHNWFCYTLGFAVCQKQKTPLERLQRLFGGTVYSYQLNRVTYWRWFTWSKNAVAAIEKVLPYLLVKRDIAELGLRFQEQMTKWNKEHGRRGYPQEIAIARDRFYLEARELNKRNRANFKAPKYVGPASQDVTVQ